jgi:hypothetical protein
MPAYGSQVYIDIEHTNQPLWTGEQPAPGNGNASASAPVKLPHVQESFFIDGFFSGDPGAFEIDVQGADVDLDAQYQTIPGGVINTRDAINFTFRQDFVNLKVRFLRLLMRTRTNAVNVYAKIVR